MTERPIIPKTMSTQHPDNASVPDWNDGGLIQGEGEVREAFFAYSSLGCGEVMWDSEGKDADTHVVRKLLSSYPEYFEGKVLGKNILLTYRVANPQIEKTERKTVTQTMHIIPLASDVASAFYKRKTAPIFEIILPFTTSGRQLVWLYNYYRKVIAGAETLELGDSVNVGDWIGSISPKSIRVIPLVEDMDSLLAIDGIVGGYLRRVKSRHLRVFIARSDPALNYGLFSATLLSKIALSRLRSVERESGVEIFPILGVGTMPFRGHLSPANAEWFLKEYRGISTVTIQSALKYDYPLKKVKETVAFLNRSLPKGAAADMSPDAERVLRRILPKLQESYQTRVEKIAPLVNSLASYVPQRRARKLHIGLFGYSRRVRGVTLPRAIPFAAALYSIGVPPEFIGASTLGDLGEEEWDVLSEHYTNMKLDLALAGSYVSWNNVEMLTSMHTKVAKRASISAEALRSGLGLIRSDLSKAEESLGLGLGPRSNVQRRHENFVNNFFISYVDGDDEEARSALIEAARLRNGLG